MTSSIVWAIAPYLDSWKTLYPSSSSGDIRCQLCHLQRDGNEPWNAYGNDIRRIFNLDLDPNTRTIEQAIVMAETLNSDQDSPATTNLVEINDSQQPAWKEGQTNQAFDRNYASIGDFFPPLTLDPFPNKIEEIDAPIELEVVVDGLVAPTTAVVAPVAMLNKQLFVADQIGVVWRIDLESRTKSKYLDLGNSLVPLGAFNSCEYDERGLIGLAFHPQFEHNGRIYVHLSEPATSFPDFTTLSNTETADHQSVIVELRISNPRSTSGEALITSRRDILRVDQPQFNHNGGALIFDSLGYLYIGFGDGGGADDQGIGHGALGNGSNPANVLGTILRIDPLGTSSANGQYDVPVTNPFTNDPSRVNEIFAYGFRNPWKIYFDALGRMFAADVGQNDIEEINLVEAGKHYGWNVKEGRFFFYDNGTAAGTIGVQAPTILPADELINPLFEYDHDEGISITGGGVYRGSSSRFLSGKHIFADFNKRLFLGDPSTGDKLALKVEPNLFVTAIAEDANRELYILGSETISTCDTISTGKVVRLKSTEPVDNSICLPIKSENGNIAIVCL